MQNYLSYYEKGISFPDYFQLLEQLMAEHKTTGNDHSPEMLNYAKLNLQRMKRVDKTFHAHEELEAALSQINAPQKWLIITEGWCGDAAQIVPLLHQIAAHSNGKINLRLVLRDENEALIDQFLTNGGRAIPILIIMKEGGEYLTHWGPRPKEAQDFVMEMKHKGVPKEEWIVEIHKWYAQNKGVAVQKEIADKLNSI
ncbi:MAG: thioredoxin family protein [Chitinophagales bacterium]|nr:thioredoxin family protein [Chitinophagales bacterium]